MNILLINHYAGSPKMGMEFRPHYMAREWIAMGHNVLIVAAGFSHLRIIQPELYSPISFLDNDDVPYCWLRTPVYNGNGIGRVKNILSFLRKLRKFRKTILKKFMPDIVIASSTYPMDIYSAKKIAKKSGAKLVFEVHDLWPLSPMLLGGMKKYHPFIMWVQRAENFAARESDKIVSLLPCTKVHFVEKGMDEKNWHYVPNGINRKDWDKILPLNSEYSEFFRNLKLTGKQIIGYVGGHAISNALDVFVETAIETKEEAKIAFVLVGAGTEKERLMQKAYACKNIYFLNPVNKKEIPALLSEMDVLFLGAKPSPLYKYGISMNKLFEYMMSGKPIIQAIEAGNNPVKEADCGITIRPENVKELINAISEILKINDEEKVTIAKNGRGFVLCNHDYSILANNFINFVTK